MGKKLDNQKNKGIDIQYGIRSIKEISYSINDSIPVTEKDLQLSIANKVEFNEKVNEINITPLIKYSNAKLKKEILKIEISNVFEIKDMKKFQSKSKKVPFDFPEDFINSLIGVSISHTRALLARNTSGTKLEKFILPLFRSSDFKVLED
jgi:hypothetical protein